MELLVAFLVLCIVLSLPAARAVLIGALVGAGWLLAAAFELAIWAAFVLAALYLLGAL